MFVLYLFYCVCLFQQKDKDMINTADFSENTKNLFSNVINKKSPLIDLIDCLFNADFDKKEILDFVKCNFKGSLVFTKKRIKQLTELN